MIYTKTGSGVGPIAGYIVTLATVAVPRFFNIYSYRKNALTRSLLSSQPADVAGQNGGPSPCLAWSNNANYLVFTFNSGGTSTGLRFYSRSGSTFTSQTVPSNFNTQTGSPSCDISSDGAFVVAASGISSVNPRIYYNASGTLTILTSVGSFNNQTYGCAVSSDGTYAAFLGATSGSSTCLRIKKRSGAGNSSTYADISLASQPTTQGTGHLDFSPDNTYLAVCGNDQNHQDIYKFNSSTELYEKLASPFSGALPDNSVVGCAFSAQGDFLAIATSFKTFFYERSGDTFISVGNVTGGRKGNFHPSGNWYITGSSQIYRKNSATSWTALGSVFSVYEQAAAFSPYI
jgi:hypothetical protein